MLYSCSRTSDCSILNYFEFACPCNSNVMLQIRQTRIYASGSVSTNHQMRRWHSCACSKFRCIEFQVFSISSSISSSLLLLHTKFSAENKPRFPHTDVARKVWSWHNEQEWFQWRAGFECVPGATAGFDSRPSTSRNRVISPYQGGLETDTQKEKMQNRMHSPWQYATGPC